jgi:predicted MPP superfamily phosphohydrolase
VGAWGIVARVLRAVLALLVGLAVLGAYGTWLYRRIAVAPRCGPTTRRTVLGTEAVGLALFVGAAVLLRRGDPAPVRPVVWLGMTVLAVALYVTIGLVLLALAALVLRVAGRPEARLRLLRVGTPSALVLTLLVTTYGVVAASRPGVEVHEVQVADLPEDLDGLRIALVTDLHVGALHDEGWTRRVVDLVAGQDPDLVLLGGDLVDGDPEHVANYLAPLRDLDPPLGTYAVTGNHELIRGLEEAREWVAAYEDLGIDVLANESVEPAPGLVLAGVHDATGTDDLAPDPEAALAGVDPTDVALYAAHEPRQVADLPAGADVDLVLSGHTHGGQLWPVHLLVPLADPITAGLGTVDGVPVLVSRGVGTSGPPVRVLADPAVDVVELSRP